MIASGVRELAAAGNAAPIENHIMALLKSSELSGDDMVVFLWSWRIQCLEMVNGSLIKKLKTHSSRVKEGTLGRAALTTG